MIFKNPKKILYKKLNTNSLLVIDENNNQYSGKKILKDTNSLINFFNRRKLFSIVEFNFEKKYLGLIVLLSCLFNNQKVYPNTEKKKIFKESFLLKNDDQLKKILLQNRTKKKLFNFKDSNYIILETSGSSGKKKRIQFNSYKYLNACEHSKKIFNYTKKNRILHCLPIYYNAGINNTLFAPLFSGSKIFFSKNFNLLNFKNILKQSIKNKINTIHLMPSMFMIFNLNFSKDLKNFVKSLISIISTGSYLYSEVNNIFKKKYSKNIDSCYGITEMGGALTIRNNKNKFVDWNVGKVLKPINYFINKRKELLIKTPFEMEGYLNKNLTRIVKKNKKKFFNTKDLAFIKNKQLYIVGRNKDIIKKGGQNISSKNIENISIKSGYIKNVFCFGKKNIYSDEDIYLIVTLKNKNSFKDKNIFYDFLIKNLDKYSMPNKIKYINKFPYFQNGKLDRLKLINSVEV